jgi:uncharacterized membrane protein HdeD (DUF308 family)
MSIHTMRHSAKEKVMSGLPVDVASLELGPTHVSALRQTGLVAIVLGVLALLFPFATGLGVNLVTGVMLVALGVAEGLRTFRTWRSRRVLGTGLFSLVAVATGTLMLLFPAAGVATMSIWLIAFFLVGGVVRIGMSLQFRDARGWGWLFASGIVSVLLGSVLWLALPGAAFWTLGVVFGIDALLFGGALLALAGMVSRGTSASASRIPHHG